MCLGPWTIWPVSFPSVLCQCQLESWISLNYTSWNTIPESCKHYWNVVRLFTQEMSYYTVVNPIVHRDSISEINLTQSTFSTDRPNAQSIFREQDYKDHFWPPKILRTKWSLINCFHPFSVTSLPDYNSFLLHCQWWEQRLEMLSITSTAKQIWAFT